MPGFDIVKKVTAPHSFRASAIISNFDIDTSHIDEHFVGEIDPQDGWQIGLIVGGVRNRENDYRKRSVQRRILLSVRI